MLPLPQRMLATLVLACACDASSSTKSCGLNTLRDGDTCVPNPLCAGNTRIEGGSCVADPGPALHCGIGTHRSGTECIPNAAVSTSSTSTTTFSANVQVSEPSLAFAIDPVMAVDSRGTIAVAALAVTEYDPPIFHAEVAVWRSTDGGGSFSRAISVAPGSGRVPADPALLFDGADGLVLAWTEYTLDDSGMTTGDIMTARADASWHLGHIELLDPMDQGSLRSRPWLSLAGDGSISLVWNERPSGQVDTSAAKRAVAAPGAMFGDAEEITGGGAVVAPLAFAASGIAVGVSNALTIWRRTHFGWTPVQAAPEAIFGIKAQPSIAWSAQRGFVIAFVGSPSYASEIYTLRSIDEGRSWMGPSPIAGEAGTTSSAELPSLTASESGRLHLLWLDDRSGGWLPYTAASDDGVHFRSEERVGDMSFVDDGDQRRSIGSLTAFVVRGGRRYAAWADSRKHDRSAIYFSSAPELP